MFKPRRHGPHCLSALPPPAPTHSNLFTTKNEMSESGWLAFDWKDFLLVSHIRSMWETTVMHKQVSGWTVNFGPIFSRIALSGIEDQNTPLPTIWENFTFGMTKVYSGIPPHFRKLQIWNDQSLLRNTPPFRKTSDLGWPKFTPEYPPHFGKLQICNDQSLLLNTPPFRKTSDLGWPKFTPEYPHISENFRFGMTKVYSGIPPLPSPMKIVRQFKSEIFRIPRVTTCGDFIQPW